MAECKMQELKKLATPVAMWVASNFSPMMTVVIEDGHVTLLEKEMGVPIERGDKGETVENLQAHDPAKAHS